MLGHTDAVRSIAFMPDGATLITGSFDGTVKIWDVAGWKERASFDAHTNGVQCVTVSGDGKLLATCDRHAGLVGVPGEIKLWDLPDGKLRAVLQGHSHRVLALAFAPNGKTLVSGGGDFDQAGEVTLWDIATSQKLVALPGHIEWIETAAFSPDGKGLVSGGGFNRNGPGELKLWDLTKVPELKFEK